MSSIMHELTCSICLELYKDPIRLSCFHVFCLKCISHFYTSARTQPLCPECQKQIDVLSIIDFKRDFKIDSMVQAIRNSPHCSVHKDHHEAHFVCKTCKVSACLEALKDHGGHDLCDVNSYIDDYNKEMSTKLPTIRRNLENLHKHLSDIHAAQEKLKDLKQKSKTEIIDELDSLINELFQIKKMWLGKMNKVFEENSTDLRRREISLENKVQTVQAILDRHEHVKTDPAKSIEFIREKVDVFLDGSCTNNPITYVKNVSDLWKQCPDITKSMKSIARRIAKFGQDYVHDQGTSLRGDEEPSASRAVKRTNPSRWLEVNEKIHLEGASTVKKIK